MKLFIDESYFGQIPSLTIKFGGGGNIKVETLTSFLEEYQKLILLINAELGYSVKDLEIEVSPPELSSFKIKILPKYKDEIIKQFGNLITTVVGGLILYHITVTNDEGNANQFINNNENGRLINKIYNSEGGRQIVNQTFVIANDDDNITSLELDEGGKEIISVDKKEINRLVSNSKLEEENFVEEDIVSDILTDKQTLILKTIHFEGQAKWAFVFRGYPIKAQFADQQFLKELDYKTFKKGDVLTVLLSRKRVFDKGLKTFIVDQNSYKIEKVLSHAHNSENSTGELGF